MALSISEQMLYSTVRITTLREGKTIGLGTGFHFNFSGEGYEKDAFIPTLITNKHVVSGADQAEILLHINGENGASGKFLNSKIDASHFLHHPDPNVDLCAIILTDVINKARTTGTDIFRIGLDLSLIPSDDEWQYLDAIEQVTMIGCPSGIYDSFNNLPIARSGNTASHIAKSYNGKSDFMVDMACFPGSSGSPIFLFNNFGYFNRKENQYLMGTPRVKLVGVLYEGPMVNNKGKIILTKLPDIITPTMMHLGVAVKSTQIKVFNQIFQQMIAATQQ